MILGHSVGEFEGGAFSCCTVLALRTTKRSQSIEKMEQIFERDKLLLMQVSNGSRGIASINHPKRGGSDWGGKSRTRMRIDVYANLRIDAYRGLGKRTSEVSIGQLARIRDSAISFVHGRLLLVKAQRGLSAVRIPHGRQPCLGLVTRLRKLRGCAAFRCICSPPDNDPGWLMRRSSIRWLRIRDHSTMEGLTCLYPVSRGVLP